MLLTRKATSQAAPQARLARDDSDREDDRPPHVPQALGHHRRRRRRRVAAAVQHDRRGRGEERGRRQDRSQAHGLHALLRGLRDRRRGAERRVGPPGAGVRLADQPRRALRQGRLGARARHHARLAPPEVPDEARGRQVEAHLLGPGLRRDLEEDARDPQAERPGRAVRGRLLQAQQRAGGAAVQVGAPLGHQQHRPPGAHLPLDHRRRRRPDLGLRRDDQLVQRRAELEVAAVPRLERRRGAPGVDAAHAARQGERLQGDRRRSALHAHRGQGRQVRAPSAPAPTSPSCSACCTTSSRTAGRTRSTSTTASTAWTR